jgi:hypothetical protein
VGGTRDGGRAIGLGGAQGIGVEVLISTWGVRVPSRGVRGAGVGNTQAQYSPYPLLRFFGRPSPGGVWLQRKRKVLSFHAVISAKRGGAVKGRKRRFTQGIDYQPATRKSRSARKIWSWYCLTLYIYLFFILEEEE